MIHALSMWRCSWSSSNEKDKHIVLRLGCGESLSPGTNSSQPKTNVHGVSREQGCRSHASEIQRCNISLSWTSKAKLLFGCAKCHVAYPPEVLGSCNEWRTWAKRAMCASRYIYAAEAAWASSPSQSEAMIRCMADLETPRVPTMASTLPKRPPCDAFAFFLAGSAAAIERLILSSRCHAWRRRFWHTASLEPNGAKWTASHLRALLVLRACFCMALISTTRSWPRLARRHADACAKDARCSMLGLARRDADACATDARCSMLGLARRHADARRHAMLNATTGASARRR